MTATQTLEWLIRIGGGGLVMAIVALWRLHVASLHRRADDWKDLYLAEVKAHAETSSKAMKLLELLEQRLRASSRPPESRSASGTKTRM